MIRPSTYQALPVRVASGAGSLAGLPEARALELTRVLVPLRWSAGTDGSLPPPRHPPIVRILSAVMTMRTRTWSRPPYQG